MFLCIVSTHARPDLYIATTCIQVLVIIFSMVIGIYYSSIAGCNIIRIIMNDVYAFKGILQRMKNWPKSIH